MSASEIVFAHPNHDKNEKLDHVLRIRAHLRMQEGQSPSYCHLISHVTSVKTEWLLQGDLDLKWLVPMATALPDMGSWLDKISIATIRLSMIMHLINTFLTTTIRKEDQEQVPFHWNRQECTFPLLSQGCVYNSSTFKLCAKSPAAYHVSPLHWCWCATWTQGTWTGKTVVEALELMCSSEESIQWLTSSSIAWPHQGS